ncbi:hypothetical protein HDV00_006621 [Rhizophlyctis rosea]|nr:hypothetical protein HDV00_006621 [Rhizophlyctis rosea]
MQRDDGKPILLVTAKLSSSAFIHDYAFGASSAASGMVAALGVADALSKSPIPMGNLSKHIVFTMFNAESYGFAGSQRFVQDLTAPFECKSTTKTDACGVAGQPACAEPCFADLDFRRINFDRIESIVEFDSVAAIGAGDVTNARASIYMHVDSVNSRTTALMNSFAGTVGNVTISPASDNSTGTNRRLPPSSAMAFLQQKDIPAVVFADYQDVFSNKYVFHPDALIMC